MSAHFESMIVSKTLCALGRILEPYLSLVEKRNTLVNIRLLPMMVHVYHSPDWTRMCLGGYKSTPVNISVSVFAERIS